ncbi:MAG: hypothetical protein ACI8PV_001009, partial [Dinoroseobacter sp.]
ALEKVVVHLGRYRNVFLKLFTNLRKYLPTPSEVDQYRYIHIFGDTLKQAELWAFNRNTVSKGIAIGLFCSFLPMPFEMIPAVFIAAMIGGNIPFAVAGVWISNPLTWLPMYTPCYLLGAKIIGVQPIPLHHIGILQVGWHYVALWLGCLIVGTSLAVIAHFTVNALWRAHIISLWQKRGTLRRSKHMTSRTPTTDKPNNLNK